MDLYFLSITNRLILLIHLPQTLFEISYLFIPEACCLNYILGLTSTKLQATTQLAKSEFP